MLARQYVMRSMCEPNAQSYKLLLLINEEMCLILYL
jgi:hypothetical protein